MNTVSTQPEATWVTRRCNWRESTSTTMSHPVSSAAPPGLRPSPSDPAVPLPNPGRLHFGFWPPIRNPSHSAPGPRPPPPGLWPCPAWTWAIPLPDRAFPLWDPGLPESSPIDPRLAFRITPSREGSLPSEVFPGYIAGCPTLSSLALGREIRRQFLSNNRIWPITESELLNRTTP